MKIRFIGFTLIEVLITVAIVAILAAVALPSYVEYVRRGKIAEGPGTLANLRVQMEQFYQDNRSYTGTLCGGACGIACPNTRYFGFTCTQMASGQMYTLSAASVANVGLGAANAYTYTVTEANTRATTRFDNVVTTTPCWRSSRADSC